MCMFKSGIILKDSVYLGETMCSGLYESESHTEMLKELKIKDTEKKKNILHYKEEKKMTNKISENQAQCKNIADTLEQIAKKNVYLCPQCGEHIVWDNNQYDDEGIYTCSECGEILKNTNLKRLQCLIIFKIALTLSIE